MSARQGAALERRTQMPELSEVANNEQYLELLAKSGLLTKKELDQSRELAKKSASCKMLARRLIAKGLLTRWQATQLLVGWYRLQLGKYTLSDQIGRGELGRVFLAEHRQMGRQVAIKTLSRRFTRKPEVVERFLADAREVAALDHRNILHVYDIDQDGDQYFLVTEYVDGEDLRRIVENRGPLPSELTVEYIRQAATALGYAHQLGMLHRDVRPANLMVDGSGTVKVLGLGVGALAEPQRAKPSKSAEGPVPELNFLAPEQTNGTGSAEARSDLFSLGCVMYYLLTGTTPQRGQASGTNSAVQEAAVPIASLRDDVPEEVVAICDKMMAVDPESRYKSADALVAVLEHWLQQRANGSPPAKPPPRPFATPANVARSAAPFDWVPSDGESKVTRAAQRSSTWADTPRTTKWVLAASLLLLLASVCSAVAMYATGRGTDKQQQPRVQRRRDTSRAAPARAEKVAMRAAVSNRQNPDVPSSEGDRPAEQAGSSNSATGAPDPSEAAAEAMKPDEAPPRGDVEKPVEPAPPEQPAPDANDGEKPAQDPKADPIKPPAPPAVNPFSELAQTVEIPEVNDTSEFEMGSLDLPPEVPFNVTLLGGNNVLRAPSRFQLDAADPATGGAWRVLLIGDKQDPDREWPLGQISAREGKLVFQWLAEAEKLPVATLFRNCVLRCVSKAHTHNLRMREPMEVNALKMSLLKPSASESYRVPALPESDIVKFQVTRLDDPFPPHTFKPAEAIEADGGKVTAILGEAADEQVVTLEIEPQLKRAVIVKCSAFFQLVPGQRPEPLTASKFETAAGQVLRNQEAMNATVQQMCAYNQKLPGNDAKKKGVENQLKIEEARLVQISQVTQKLEILSELRSTLKDGGAVHYRMFFTVDDCEVELLRTVATDE